MHNPNEQINVELTDKHLSLIQSFYEQAGTISTWAGRQYRRILAHYYERLIPKNSTVLEVGCGDGELLVHLKDRNITGIDLSPAQIALAKAKVPHGTFEVQAGE